jgi:Putative Ig domain
MLGLLAADFPDRLSTVLKGAMLAAGTPTPSPTQVSSDDASALPGWLLIALLAVVTLVIVGTFGLTFYSLSAPRSTLKNIIGRSGKRGWFGSGTDSQQPPLGTVTPQLVKTLATAARSGRRTTRTTLAIVGFSLLGVLLIAIFGLSGQGVRDLRSQVIAAVTTLVATIAGFYFGAETARNPNQGGSTNAAPGLGPDPKNPTFLVNVPGTTYTPKLTGTPAPTVSLTKGTLPAGLVLDPATGVISGTAADGTANTYPITLTAKNGISPDANLPLTLTVAATSAPGIQPDPSGPTFTVGQEGKYTPILTGTPAPTVTLTQGTLPAGLKLDPAGVISGTPATGSANPYPITLRAANGISPDAELSVVLTVSAAPQPAAPQPAAPAAPQPAAPQPATAPPSLEDDPSNPQFTVGVPGTTYTPRLAGTPAPTVTLTQGALPADLELDAATGVISGTPAAGTSGTYEITLTAHNGVGSDATLSVTLTVIAQPDEA